MRYPVKVTLNELRHQRNGVGGEPFTAAYFTFKEDATSHELLAIIPGDLSGDPDLDPQYVARPERVYIVTPGAPDAAWRGDRIGAVLLPLVRANFDAAWPDLYPDAAARLPQSVRTSM